MRQRRAGSLAAPCQSRLPNRTHSTQVTRALQKLKARIRSLSQDDKIELLRSLITELDKPADSNAELTAQDNSTALSEVARRQN